VSPYGVSKLASEFYLAAYAQLHDLDVVSLRYANVYGPRQSPHGEAGVVAIFGTRLRKRQPLTIYGDGRQTRDYVFVGDVARANIMATGWAVSSIDTIDDVAFNVGTATETSVLELANALRSATGVTVPVEHAPERRGELLRSAVGIEKAAKLLDWHPKVELADGLRQTYDWIAESAA
jgi:UDP-glucose 4-epimerase